MSFRASLRAALAHPEGGSLAARFAAPLVTAIVADGEGDGRDDVALAETLAALTGVGLPRGRVFVLLTAAASAGDEAGQRPRALHDSLGVPVLVHDAARAAHHAVGAHAELGELQLDDELREAEAVVVVGRFAADAHGRLVGGPALLWPGLASAACVARAARAADGGALAAYAHAKAVCDTVGVDFALLWSADDPPRVLAGHGAATFERCVREGWLAAAARSVPESPK